MAGRRRNSRVVDRHRPAARVAPRRDLDIRRAMRRAGRLQLRLYTARRSEYLPRRFISPRRRRNRPRRRARRPALPLRISGRSRAAAVLSRSRRAHSHGRLGDAPPGFIIMPAQVWKTHQSEALDFEPVLTSDHGNRHLVLVKRGKSYASLAASSLCGPHHRFVPGAIDHVIVHHPGRLHHRVADCRSDELESAPDQLLAHRVRLDRARRHLLQRAPLVDPRPSADESPDVIVEAAELFLHGDERLRVADRGIDLQPIANDPRVREQSRHVAIAELRDARGIEFLEGDPIGVALAQDRVPAQSGLCAFERDELEPSPIVMDRDAPLFIVVANRQFVARPSASHNFVLIPRSDEIDGVLL